MTTQDQILEQWSNSLLAAYELEGIEVDVKAVLSLAAVAAHSIVRPAAPLTTFIAGYAAGRAAGAGQPLEPASMAAAMELAHKLAAGFPGAGNDPEATTGEASGGTATAPAVGPTE